jgi:hypothetical protein
MEPLESGVIDHISKLTKIVNFEAKFRVKLCRSTLFDESEFYLEKMYEVN